MSLFDHPRRILNPTLWDGMVLKSSVKEYLTQLLFQVFPEEKLSSLMLIGSSVAYQYSSTSDVDISVIAIKGETQRKWHKVLKAFNKRGNYLPGTLHRINYMFMEYVENLSWDNALGIYNILDDRWEKKPIPYNKLGDPKEKYVAEIRYADMLLRQIESEVALMNEVRLHDPEQYEEIKKRLAILFKTIEDNRKTAYIYGTGTPSLQEYNIIFKIIEGSQYGSLMEEMIDVYDDTHKVDTDE